MEALSYEMIRKGYVILPKVLLEERIKSNRKAMGDLEAFFVMLATVNYRDNICHIKGKELICARGEAMLSIQAWSLRFHWNRSKTRRFFERMTKEKLIETLENKWVTHIRILQYDLWTCRQKAYQDGKTQVDEEFREFWKEYHKVTQTDKKNIARARREWQKLTDRERAEARKQINEYYFHLNDTRFCLQAAGYLSNKAFLNEYIY